MKIYFLKFAETFKGVFVLNFHLKILDEVVKSNKELEKEIAITGNLIGKELTESILTEIKNTSIYSRFSVIDRLIKEREKYINY